MKASKINKVKVPHPSMTVGEVRVEEMNARVRRCGATVKLIRERPMLIRVMICIRQR